MKKTLFLVNIQVFLKIFGLVKVSKISVILIYKIFLIFQEYLKVKCNNL